MHFRTYVPYYFRTYVPYYVPYYDGAQPELPGARGPAAYPRVGRHAQRRPLLPDRRPARGHDPRPGHPDHGPLLQPAGRLPARRAGPRAEGGPGTWGRASGKQP